MPLGPGKFDPECTLVRKMTGAESVIVIVINGTLGSGFSCQASLEVLFKLPGMLLSIADELERSGAKA